MEKIVQVAEKEGEEIIELPLEDDGSLLYSTLVKFFPKARGLWYYIQSDSILGVRLANGKFYSPLPNWGSTVFYCVFFEESNDCVMDKTETPVNDVKTKHLTINSMKSITESGDCILEEEKSLENNLLFPGSQNKKTETLSEESMIDDVEKEAKYKIMPYRCDICSHSFTLQANMVRHRRIHMEKPFSCSTFDEKYSRVDFLKPLKCHAITQLASATLDKVVDEPSDICTYKHETKRKKLKNKNNDEVIDSVFPILSSGMTGAANNVDYSMTQPSPVEQEINTYDDKVVHCVRSISSKMTSLKKRRMESENLNKSIVIKSSERMPKTGYNFIKHGSVPTSVATVPYWDNVPNEKNTTKSNNTKYNCISDVGPVIVAVFCKQVYTLNQVRTLVNRMDKESRSYNKPSSSISKESRSYNKPSSSNSENSRSCPYCSYKCMPRVSLRTHVLKQHLNCVKKYCGACGQFLIDERVISNTSHWNRYCPKLNNRMKTMNLENCQNLNRYADERGVNVTWAKTFWRKNGKGDEQPEWFKFFDNNATASYPQSYFSLSSEESD